MSQRLPYTILGVGSALPPRIMPNAEFESFLDTSDEWIQTRTGIRERRICGDDEDTLTLALEASRNALNNAGLTPADLDMIVVATSTPAYPIPASACFLQSMLGCGHIPAFDLAAACSGFVYGLSAAAGFMHSANYRRILVVGAEAMSRVTDFQDRTMCILLGDAAGAAILGPAEDEVSGIYDQAMGADGSGAELIYVPAGGSHQPATPETVEQRQHYIKMRGREVYRFAVTKMQQVIAEAVERAGISVDDLALVVPHQSNARIIESAAEKLKIPMERVAMNIDRFGNTSAASIPLALQEAVEAGRAKKHDWVLLAGFGGGLTWGSVLIRL